MNWWDLNATEADMLRMVGDHTTRSKVASRQYIQQQRYASILDCGAGLCSEYTGYKLDRYSIRYQAIDSCDKFVQRGQALGINIVQGSVEAIPKPDQSVDVVYLRHVLEHLPGYEQAISEAIRVARQEVLIVFFLVPTKSPATIHNKHSAFPNSIGPMIHHNRYNLQELVQFITAQPDVTGLSQETDPEESLWHIHVSHN